MDMNCRSRHFIQIGIILSN